MLNASLTLVFHWLQCNMPAFGNAFELPILKMGHSRPPFYLFSSFQYSWQFTMFNKTFPMMRFEPRTSGVGSNSFANWATTTAPIAYLTLLDFKNTFSINSKYKNSNPDSDWCDKKADFKPYHLKTYFPIVVLKLFIVLSWRLFL